MPKPGAARWGWRLARLTAPLAVGAVLCATALGTATAAYTDGEYAQFGAAVGVIGGGEIDFTSSTTTYLAGTFVALAADRRAAYVWGYRGVGLSGTGAETVASGNPVSVVRLPEDKRMVKITGGAQGGTSLTVCAAIAVLDEDGRVWTWGNSATPERLGRTVTSGDNSRPKPVSFEGQRIVDVQSGTESMTALTSTGDLYTWGCAVTTSSSTSSTKVEDFGQLGQGDYAYDTVPRKVMTGVHSFGVGASNTWAIASAWTAYRYASAKGGSLVETYRGSAGVVMFGCNRIANGSASGDPVNFGGNVYRSPSSLSDQSVLSGLYKAGVQAGDDNTSLGVMMGSAADKGTFKQMTGHIYGSQVLLRNGDVYLWGYSGYNGSGTGLATSGNDTKVKQVPVKATLGNGVKIAQISHTRRLVLLLDTAGTVWIYGHVGGAEGVFPTAAGAPGMTSSNRASRVDGGKAYPGWAAGGINSISSFGGASVLLTRSDGSVWTVGGGAADASSNTDYMVRDWWDARNKIAGGSGSKSVALTKLNLDGLG